LVLDLTWMYMVTLTHAIHAIRSALDRLSNAG
jgi:hypothetical protein